MGVKKEEIRTRKDDGVGIWGKIEMLEDRNRDVIL